TTTPLRVAEASGGHVMPVIALQRVVASESLSDASFTPARLIAAMSKEAPIATKDSKSAVDVSTRITATLRQTKTKTPIRRVPTAVLSHDNTPNTNASK